MKNVLKTFLLMLVPMTLMILYACANTQSIAKVHPIELKTAPICSDCHTNELSAMNHTAGFIDRHKFYAAQKQQVCNVCHTASFCSDCHAHKENIKPSDKYRDEPERSLPHRGDYISQHQIDGRINPALCARCHGRTNNERCRACHK